MTLLEIQRTWYTPKSTIGQLFLNGQFQCYTLEDTHHEVKVFGETCIPAGGYDVDITFSNRFGKWMPLLLNVPGFQGIRIHCGNTDKDTEGCILLGAQRAVDEISQSRAAYDELFPKLKAAKDAGDPIRIIITESKEK